MRGSATNPLSPTSGSDPMPYRRARSSSRGRPFRRRRLGLRSDPRLRRWEFANISFAINQFGSSSAYVGTNTPLAQIPTMLSDLSTANGVLDAYKMRAVEVGGIVFNSFVFQNGQPIQEVSAHVLCYHVLFSARLDRLGNLPLNPTFDQPTPPTITAASALLSQFQTEWPDKIHWRENRVLPIGSFDVGKGNPQNYSSGARSLRLRLRLSDEYGLFFHTGIRGPASLLSNYQLTHVVNGTLYWRARY